MDNYEYVIAGLPALSRDWTSQTHLSASELMDDIRALCSAKDCALIDTLLSGYEEQNFNAGFYSSMLKHPDRFLREYFRFDLNLRNAKVRYLNGRLGIAADKGIFLEDELEFEEADALDKVLATEDLLEREKGLDALVWDKISDINTFDYFDVDAILGFIAKLKIVDRWLQLDESSGREMFRRLVDEVHGTFKGVHFNEK